MCCVRFNQRRLATTTTIATSLQTATGITQARSTTTLATTQLPTTTVSTTTRRKEGSKRPLTFITTKLNCLCLYKIFIDKHTHTHTQTYNTHSHYSKTVGKFKENAPR